MENGGEEQQMFSKGRTGSHLCVSDLGLDGNTDPQTGALVAFSLLTKAHLWVGAKLRKSLFSRSLDHPRTQRTRPK